jgi:hypothetical protein
MSTVFAPRTISKLIAVRTRAHYGTFELARRFPELWINKGNGNILTLIELLKAPGLWPGCFIYCYVNLFARYWARIRLRTGTFVWERDDTSRGALPNGSPR